MKRKAERAPICGGHDYSVSLSTSDSIGIHDRARIWEKGNKINGKKKNCRDIVTGADYSKQCGKYVEKIRDINRTDDKYTEIVRDYETGEIIHFCNEKLSAHTGHGSAKLKNSKKQI